MVAWPAILLEPYQPTRFGLPRLVRGRLEIEDTAQATGAGPILSTLLQRRGFGSKNLDLSFTVPQQVMVERLS